MRYCRFCRRLSIGKPRYCRSCSRSFNIKICPSGHPNIRGSTFCAECGSSDLSQPQPRLSGFVRLGYVIAVILLFLSSIVYLLYFASALLTNPNDLLKPMLVGFFLGLFWLFGVMFTDASR